ncbi:NADAR family protein [Tahibacter amnicola]|uniref:NADAR family protein n=1 Tax=Tahibacter amnicola TaxID=2976241 RepID=A0ABY6BF84_9GAMM|nr:NADAR family protein [Tahibacter amnicola]UXI67933.1 NADAR family protein [Tahibacter amnicola]
MNAPTQAIRFYRTTDDYGEFSNFARYSIFVDGKRWPTSEHYFQAMKFHDEASRNEIRRASTPAQAAEKGRDRKRKLRNDWESVKDEVMRKALIAKFTQHDELRQLLLDTGDAWLIEHTANDSYWGDGGDGSGKNKLGQLLMQVRDQIRKMPPK